MDFGITFLKLATKWCTYTKKFKWHCSLQKIKENGLDFEGILKKMGWMLSTLGQLIHVENYMSNNSQSCNMGYEILSLCN